MSKTSGRDIQALTGHLHDQLARLMDPDIKAVALEKEVKRSSAVVKVSAQIIDGERAINERARIVAEHQPDRINDVLQIPKAGDHS